MSATDDLDLLIATPTKMIEGEVHETPSDEIWVRNNDEIHHLVRQIRRKIQPDDTHQWRYVDLACIGAACVNQAIKAIAIVRDELRDEANINVYCVPYFSTIIDDRQRRRTRMMIRVIPADTELCAS
jgi:stage V sporulation protein SpoVS